MDDERFREWLVREAAAKNRSLKDLSLNVLDRNESYLQQYVKRQSPRKLDHDDKAALTRALTGKSAQTDAAVSVIEIDTRASAGAGALVEYEQDSHVWSFPDSWLRAGLNASAADLRIITIDGDSMVSDPPRGTDIMPGDKVVINVADKRPSPPGVFILHDGLGLVAKRVEFIAGSDPHTVRIMSNSPHYQTYERTADEINIVGRLVARWQRIS